MKMGKPDGITTDWEDMCHNKKSIFFCTRLKGHKGKHKCYDGSDKLVNEWN